MICLGCHDAEAVPDARLCAKCRAELLEYDKQWRAQKNACAPIHDRLAHVGGHCDNCGYDILPVGYAQ